MWSECRRRTRREVVAGLAGAAFAPLAARTNLYRPRLVAQTYIWLLELKSRNRALADGLDEALSGTHRAGFQSVELMPEFVVPELREQTFRLLRKYDLQPTIGYASGEVYQRAQAETVRAQVLQSARMLQTAGTRFMNFSPNPKPGEQRKTDAELETQAYQVNRLGQELQDLGMQLLLHHHQAEMRENAREWRYFLRHTDTRVVRFCLDVDWVTRAGLDPVVLMDEAGGRVASLHLRNPRNGAYQEQLAEGDVRMVKIADFLRQSFYQGFLVVELIYDKDTPRSHSLPTALSLSRMYVHRVFGARPGAMPVDMGPHVRTKEL